MPKQAGRTDVEYLAICDLSLSCDNGGRGLAFARSLHLAILTVIHRKNRFVIVVLCNRLFLNFGLHPAWKVWSL